MMPGTPGSAPGALRPQLMESLSQQITDITSKDTPTREQLDEKDQFLNRLQETIGQVIDGAVVSPFGSAVNGFWSPNSDIDICIQIPKCRTRSTQIHALRRIASALQGASSHSIEPRFGARVPIIRWAPRRPGFLACDISVNNSLAVYNSRLVGTYTSIDPRMRPLGMVIKYWAKNRSINDRSRGTLSSFSLLLMLIHFLQRRGPPVLPSLQDLALEMNLSPVYCNGADIRFVSDRDLIDSDLGRICPDGPNRESLGELLSEFYRFYGFEYRSGVIAVRDIRGFHGETEGNFLYVDNPFEIGKDVANVMPNQYNRIRAEFRRVYQLISDGRTDLAEICQRIQPPPPDIATPRAIRTRHA
jgi:DNA polymerase sigma